MSPHSPDELSHAQRRLPRQREHVVRHPVIASRTMQIGHRRKVVQFHGEWQKDDWRQREALVDCTEVSKIGEVICFSYARRCFRSSVPAQVAPKHAA